MSTRIRACGLLGCAGNWLLVLLVLSALQPYSAWAGVRTDPSRNHITEDVLAGGGRPLEAAA